MHQKSQIKSYFKVLLSFFSLIFFSLSLYSQSNDDCLTCHSDKDLTMEKHNKKISLFVNENELKSSSHYKLKCISCHTGFDAENLPHKEKIDPINCKNCHKDAAVKHPFHPQMIKSTGTSGTKDLDCKGCHGLHNISVITSSEKSPVQAKKLNEFCGKCHKEKINKFVHSAHSKASEKGVQGAPNCITCHKSAITNVNIKIDTLQIKQNQEKLCLSCHLDNPDVRSRITPTAGFIKAYENSVHGRALHKGNSKAANCVSCHTSHEVEKGNNPNSTVFKLNVYKTCEKCHTKIANEYNGSVHAVGIQKGNMDSPTCTNCHGEHNILKHNDPSSPVASQNVSAQVCSPCHSSVKLSDKFGLAANKVQTFKDTYHGLALRGGSSEAANCASCHGYHNIKSSSDSASSIHKINLVKTCGKCHPGANQNFAVGTVHVTMEKAEEPILYWISTIYLILIFTLIGGMLLHNLLDFIKKAKRKQLIRRGIIQEHKYGHSLYLRMTLSERIQHFSLLISFFTLVLTGFMLRFPDTWWVKHIRDLSEHAFEYRSLLHRIAAVVMVSASVYHLVYLFFTKRGKQLLYDLLPRYNDLKNAISVMKYNLGISETKPKLDRFSYIEKAEYWALVWGTLIMTATGFIMWFDNTFIGILTKLGWDIARTVHYYEAWLAFLAIIVWHLYFVIFNPDIYPMNLTWLKGTITEEEMEEEHPIELERIKKQEELKSNLSEVNQPQKLNNEQN